MNIYLHIIAVGCNDTLITKAVNTIMTLSFMALLVIPELKLSDKGLFDGNAFHFINYCRSSR